MGEVKDIYLAELAEIKARIAKSRKAQVGAWVIVAVAILVLACVLFFRSPRKDYPAIDDRVEFRDSIIAAKEETIKQIEAQREEILESIEELKKQNQVLQRSFAENQKKHQQNNTEYEKVSSDVLSMSWDSLLGEYNRYPKASYYNILPGRKDSSAPNPRR